MAVLVLALGAAFAPLRGAYAAEKKSVPDDLIVITGASGGLAGEAVEELTARGVPIEKLILVTRTPEKLSALKERGADVRAGDFNRPDSLRSAFAGGKQMLLVSTSGGGDRVTQHTAAISAAVRAGIKHIVYTSWINAVEDNPAAVTRDHRLTEQALAKSGVAYTVLRNQLYAEGLIAEGARAVATGVIITNAGNGRWAPVARRDCAAAAAAVLAIRSHEGGRIYEITGPDLIGEKDFATMLTQITGKPVRVLNVNDSTYIATLVKAGVPEAGAKVAASFGQAKRENYINIRSETLKLLIGRQPESVRQILTDNKALLLAPAPAPAADVAAQ